MEMESGTVGHQVANEFGPDPEVAVLPPKLVAEAEAFLRVLPLPLAHLALRLLVVVVKSELLPFSVINELIKKCGLIKSHKNRFPFHSYIQKKIQSKLSFFN